MTQVFITDSQSAESALDIKPGASLMQVITDAGMGDLLALCGGMCSCATCHVYVAEDFLTRLPEMSEDEKDLLEMSAHHAENSRLACQIRLTDELSGLAATIAPCD